jgi:hypothetical protein
MVVDEGELFCIERVLSESNREGIQHGIPRCQTLAHVGDRMAQQSLGDDRHDTNAKPASNARPLCARRGGAFPTGMIHAKDGPNWQRDDDE